mmetsp:Transcript_91569/g.296244  ORF Transcript_91569/g.296244 Transcript_91569/m.296244 type:complete len:238 (-) Transcript_91569:540-1253(-)
MATRVLWASRDFSKVKLPPSSMLPPAALSGNASSGSSWTSGLCGHRVASGAGAAAAAAAARSGSRDKSGTRAVASAARLPLAGAAGGCGVAAVAREAAACSPFDRSRRSQPRSTRQAGKPKWPAPAMPAKTGGWWCRCCCCCACRRLPASLPERGSEGAEGVGSASPAGRCVWSISGRGRSVTSSALSGASRSASDAWRACDGCGRAVLLLRAREGRKPGTTGRSAASRPTACVGFF